MRHVRAVTGAPNLLFKLAESHGVPDVARGLMAFGIPANTVALACAQGTVADIVLNAVVLERCQMTSLPIPDAVLPWSLELSRKMCAPFTDFGDGAKKLFDRMTATMFYLNGQGLAAPQIGVFEQAAIIHFGNCLYPIFNPQILEMSGKKSALEACLSLPGSDKEGKLVQSYCYVMRATLILVQYQDADGGLVRRSIKGHEARVFLHESDHLLGKFIIDRTGKMYRDAVLRRYQNWRRACERGANAKTAR